MPPVALRHPTTGATTVVGNEGAARVLAKSGWEPDPDAPTPPAPHREGVVVTEPAPHEHTVQED